MDYVIDKASKRFYALLQLKRLGVSTEKLALFYVSNIRSVLVYCIASFFSQLNDRRKEGLDRVQSLCSKIILAIPNLCEFSLEQYRCQFFKILNNPDHVLHWFIPELLVIQRTTYSERITAYENEYRISLWIWVKWSWHTMVPPPPIWCKDIITDTNWSVWNGWLIELLLHFSQLLPYLHNVHTLDCIEERLSAIDCTVDRIVF